MTEIRVLADDGTPEQRGQRRRERERLREYLRGYAVAARSVVDYRRRLQQIRDDLNAPIGATKWEQAPGHSSVVSDPTSRPVMAEFTVLERLEDALRAAQEAQREIMDVLALLPAVSVERRVLELKYVDAQPEWEICEALERGRTAVYEAEQAGLDKLLAMPSVRRRLGL